MRNDGMQSHKRGGPRHTVTVTVWRIQVRVCGKVNCPVVLLRADKFIRCKNPLIQGTG